MSSKCMGALALGAAGLSMLLSPGFLVELPQMHDGKLSDKKIGFRTNHSNVWAVLVHSLLAYLLFKHVVTPFVLNKMECAEVKVVVDNQYNLESFKKKAASKLNESYASNLRQYIAGDNTPVKRSYVLSD